MSHDKKQIFQTHSNVRWLTFKWTGRLIIFFLLLTIPLVWIAMAKDYKPLLPSIDEADTTRSKQENTNMKFFSRKEARKYKGIDAYLHARNRNNMLANAEKHSPFNDRVRAAFLVDWDPQSFYSLQNHISQLNMVVPEWFFIDLHTDSLRMAIDPDAYAFIKQHKVRLIPSISNVDYSTSSGGFRSDVISRLLRNRSERERFLQQILSAVKQYGFQGVNIDFEEIRDQDKGLMLAFQHQLYDSLHTKGYLLTQDILPNDDNYKPAELASVNDYLFLMAYDQHYTSSAPGPVSEQKWIEKELDETAAGIDPDKIILCLAGYGYDWPGNETATPVTYQEALSLARQYNATIDYDNDSYSSSFSYTDGNGIRHQVFFEDAGANFNCMRFADEYGTAGVALWRLGAEDERLWSFYDRNLSDAALKKTPFSFSTLETFNGTNEKPDYIGDGEVLDVVTEPEVGRIRIETDTSGNLVSEETYLQLPTRYVIRKSGNVKNQVILTFDDGPDPAYTPEILNILEKEKVPAAFFVVGVNAEAHLPLLKRIYHDGFEIGNHTFTHPNMANVSDKRAETEMDATRLLIESAIGRSTILFRAPFNADAEPTRAEELKPLARSRKQNYYTIGESIDPEDWDVEHGVNADSIVNRVIRQYERNPQKGIILLHDAGGDRKATVEALPRIIAYFRSKGVGFSTVAGLLHKTRDDVMPPVSGQLIRLNGWVSLLLYWFMKFLFAAFWVAILLGLFKIFGMAILATLQFFRSRKEKFAATYLPGVSIIVPAYNEEVNAVATIRNLLLQDYPRFSILFVDDGSKDETFRRVSEAFRDEPRVQVFTKPNGGKASALNYGIAQADHEYVVCIDADTQLMPDAVYQLMKYFSPQHPGKDPVVAVAGNVKVGNEKNLLTKWQSIEYTTAQNFDRRAFDRLNCISVIPGAIGAFSKQAVIDAGGFTTDTLAEDCDLTIRLLRNGGVVRSASHAVAVTEAPETLRQFMKQRFRWSYGIMQSFWKNRDACFNPRYKALGMVSLPNILLFQILMPVLAPLADLLFFISIAWSWNDPESRDQLLLFYGLFLLVDVAVSFLAFVFEGERFSKLIWLIPQRFVYRQLMYVILFRSIIKAIRGEGQGWGVLKRTGNVNLHTAGKNAAGTTG